MLCIDGGLEVHRGGQQQSGIESAGGVSDEVNDRVGARSRCGNGLQQVQSAHSQAGGGQGFHAVNPGGHPGLIKQFPELIVNVPPVGEVTEIGEAEETGYQEDVAFH